MPGLAPGMFFGPSLPWIVAGSGPRSGRLFFESSSRSTSYLSMIFSEKPVPTFRDHALGSRRGDHYGHASCCRTRVRSRAWRDQLGQRARQGLAALLDRGAAAGLSLEVAGALQGGGRQGRAQPVRDPRACRVEPVPPRHRGAGDPARQSRNEHDDHLRGRAADSPNGASSTARSCSATGITPPR